MTMGKETGLFVVFVVLLLSSTILVTSVSGEGFLSDILENIKKWFESSPFGNILSAPVKSTEEVVLVFNSDGFALEIPTPVNITTNTSRIINFKGMLKVDNEEGKAIFTQSGSSLSVEESIAGITINNLMLDALELNSREVHIMSGNWNETSQNGSVEMKDFVGRAILTHSTIKLQGNVSKISKG